MTSGNMLFEFLNSINHNKKNIMDDGNRKEYKPYVINKFLGGTIDTVLYANEMNMRYDMPIENQYAFLRSAIRPRKRFTKWLKSPKEDKIETIKQYFDYSDVKAKAILDLIDGDELKEMKRKLDIGG